jgi:hypothetical protein
MELYGKFQEKGYDIEAYIPSKSNESMEFKVRALKDGKVVRELKIPLNHTPIFGIDVEDHQNLEIKTEELLSSLP